ncbi:MAG: WS/DGAT domain-containing protein [Roseateles sp.]
MTNQVSFMMVSLATDIKDPLARLKAIHESAASGKKVSGQIKGAIPMDFPSLGAPWLMSGLASLYGRSRLADTLPPVANVTISNVPGPQAPFYLAGAKVATYSPVSIPAHGVALNVTVQSYNGVVEFGLTACRRALPDVGDLGDYMVDAAHELGQLIAAAAAAARAAGASAALAEQPSADVAARVPRPRREPPKALATGQPRPSRRAAAQWRPTHEGRNGQAVTARPGAPGA